MRQHVTAAPLRHRDEIAGIVVTIEDVTERFDRERRLAADLDSDDEAVRLRATTALAAGGDAPSLLSAALGDSSWRVRRVAAEGMAAGGGRAVVDTLIEAVRDHHRNPALLNAAVSALARASIDITSSVIPLLEAEDADVRTYASLALGLMNDPRAVPALIARLDDADANVQFHAIEALGRIGDRAATDAVATIAERRDFFLAFPALDALAAIGDPVVAGRLLALLDDELLLPAVVACLGALGTEEVLAPVARLASGVAVAPVAQALAAIHERIERTMDDGPLVVDVVRGAMTLESARAMTAALPTANVDERRALAVVLSWLPFDGIDRELALLLHDDAMRETAAASLSTRSVAAAEQVQQVAVSTDTPDVLRAAAFVLGRIGSPTSVPALIAMLDDGADPGVIGNAAGALGAIGDGRAFPRLLELMDHDAAIVRQAVVAALNSIGHPKMEAAIAGRLSDPSPHMRESAARVAGYFGYDSCLRQMVELCDDDNPVVRRAAVESLANFDCRPAWSKVNQVAGSDSDPSVRAAAVRALGQHRSDESVPALVTALRDPNLWVRYYAARACMRRHATHVDIVTALLECAIRDQAPPVRIAAVEALAALEAPSTLEILVSLTHDPDLDVSSAAVVALGHFAADRTAQTLELFLRDSDTRRQLAALDALGQRGSAASHSVTAIAALAQSTRDAGVRDRAVQALVENASDAAVRALVLLAEDHRFAELVTGAVSRLPEQSLSRLERELEKASGVTRSILVNGIGRMKHRRAARALAIALNDSSPQVRSAAEAGLARRDLRDSRMSLRRE